jgi:hypothetical protein
MEFKRRTLMALGEMICGDAPHFPYRTSSQISEFFQDCETPYRHNGGTRRYWTADTVAEILKEPQPATNIPPESFARVIRVLMEQGDAVDDTPEREKALAMLNAALSREGF